MFVGTTFPWYGLHDGSLPYSENTPLYPQLLATVHAFPTADGVKVNVLSSTCTFCVFRRQSEKYGCFLTRAGVEQALSVAFGSTIVQYPLLVLSGDPQNRLEFSQRMTPPQLFTKLLCAMRNWFL